MVHFSKFSSKALSKVKGRRFCYLVFKSRQAIGESANGATNSAFSFPDIRSSSHPHSNNEKGVDKWVGIK